MISLPRRLCLCLVQTKWSFSLLRNCDSQLTQQPPIVTRKETEFVTEVFSRLFIKFRRHMRPTRRAWRRVICSFVCNLGRIPLLSGRPSLSFPLFPGRNEPFVWSASLPSSESHNHNFTRFRLHFPLSHFEPFISPFSFFPFFPVSLNARYNLR